MRDTPGSKQHPTGMAHEDSPTSNFHANADSDTAVGEAAEKSAAEPRNSHQFAVGHMKGHLQQPAIANLVAG